MRIDISFTLNTVERDLLLQQIRKEFAQHVDEFNQLERVLPEPKDDKRRVKIQRGINVQGMKCYTLCGLAECFNAEGFVREGKSYSFSEFRKLAEGKFLTTPNKKNKLVIHLMHRAGILSKEKMQEILKLRKYNGEERTFKALSHFKDEISKNLKMIKSVINFEDFRKIVNSTNYMFGCIRDVMERRKL
jgi:hypothetical protein